MRALIQTAACGLLGTVLVVSGAPGARAADDDEPGIDQKILQNVMQGIGLRGGPPIDYRERSPLVLPPQINLPPPQADATRAPNWPVDAEAKRRKEQQTRRFDEVNDTRALRPSELNVGQPQRSRSTATSQDHPDGKPMGPSELGYKGGLFGSLFGSKSESAAQFTNEPARSSLTEPPVGYQNSIADAALRTTLGAVGLVAIQAVRLRSPGEIGGRLRSRPAVGGPGLATQAGSKLGGAAIPVAPC